MPTVADVNVKFGADTSDVDKGIAHVDKGLGGLTKRFGGALAVATGNVLSQAFNQLVGGFGQAIAGGLEFGKQMANVNSILKLSDAQLADLSDQVLDLTNNPGIRDMPATLAAGLYNINSSGFAGAEGMQILEASAIAASAGLTTTDVAARGVTAVLNAYGLAASDADHVSDLLFQTVNDGVISFDELVNNLGSTIPMANALGVSLENLFGAYSQLTLQGILPSAAETDIAALMKTAMAPTEALTAAVQEQGYATAQQALAQLDLAGYTKLITDYSDKYGVTLTDLLGTQEAVNAAIALGGGNAEAYAEEINNMNHASDGAGATQEALNEQMQSASFQLDKLKQQAQVFATVLTGFVSPSIAKFAAMGTKGLGKLTNWVQGFHDGYKRLLNVKGIGIGNKLGIVGPDGQVFQSRMGKMTALTTVMSARFKALTGIDASNWFKRMGQSILRPFDASKKLLGALTSRDWDNALAGFGDLVASGPKAIGDFFKGIETGIKPVDKLLHTFGKSWTDVGRLIQEAGQGDWDGFQVVLDRLGGHLLQLGEQLGGFAIDALKFTVNAAINVAPKLGEIVWGGAKDLYGWIEDKILGTVGGGGGAAITAGGGGGPVGGRQIEGSPIDVGVALLKFGVDLAGDIWGGGKDLVGWLTSKIVGGSSGGAAITAGGGGGPSGGPQTTIPVGTVLISAFIDAGSDLLGWIVHNIPIVAGWLKDGIEDAINIGKVGISFIPDLINIVWEGASDFAGWVQQKLTGGSVSYGPNGSVDPARGGGQAGVSIGSVGVSFIATWGGMIWEAASDFGSWFKANVGEVPEQAMDVSVKLSAGFTSDGYIWLNAYSALKDWVTAGPYVLSPEVKLDIRVGAYDITTSLINAISINKMLLGLGIMASIGSAIMLAPLVIPTAFAYKFGPAVLSAITGVTFGVGGAIADKIAGEVADTEIALHDLIFSIPFVPDIELGFLDSELIDAIVAALPFPLRVAIRFGLDVAIGAPDPPDEPPPPQPPQNPGLPGRGGISGSDPRSETPATPSSQPTVLPDGTIVNSLPNTGSGPGAGMVVPPPDTSKFQEVLNKLPTMFGEAMDRALQLASTVATGINTALTAQFTNLVTSIGAILAPIPTIIGLPFDRALQTVSVVVGAIPNSVVGAMNSTASQGAAAAYNAGASISGALAAGIRLLIPDVYAAAHELGVAAESGTNAAIKRNSPPRVFVDMGHDIGDALADSISDKYATVVAAGRGLGNAAVQPSLNPAWSVTTSGRTGGDTYHITIVTPDSDTFSEIARDSKRGATFARDLGQLIRNI